MIQQADLSPFDTLFSFVTDTDEVVHVAIDRLLARLKTHPRPIRRMRFQQEDINHVFSNCGVEGHRLARITKADIDKYPIVFLIMPDESHLLADGAHRYLAAATRFGLAEIDCYMLRPAYWHRFRVTLRDGDLRPTEISAMLRTMRSGIQ